VIHPRSSGGNADKERASVASVVPSSFMASGGAAASAPNIHPTRLIIPILEISFSPARLAHRQVAERHQYRDRARRVSRMLQSVVGSRVWLLLLEHERKAQLWAGLVGGKRPEGDVVTPKDQDQDMRCRVMAA
jgi:hypothetical protein